MYSFQPLDTMKIYAVSDGPPSLAVRMALKALDIAHEHVPVDYGKGEHMTEDYAKVGTNFPQMPDCQRIRNLN